MDIKRYYITDLSFVSSKCNICVCRPFEQGNRLFTDVWHPVTQRFYGQLCIGEGHKEQFFANIKSGFYSPKEAFDAVINYQPEVQFSKKMATTGFKILRHDRYNNAYLLAVLEISAQAKKIMPYFSNKMRTDRALVKDILRVIPYRNSYITDLYDGDSGISAFSPKKSLCYSVGNMVRADYLDEDRTMVATHGIHFYLTSEEALSSLTLSEH